MKTGRSLIDLATEIERQAAAKKDYIADTRKLEMQVVQSAGDLGAEPYKPGPDTVQLVMNNGAQTRFQVGTLAHRQIGERVGIPAKYYDRMLVEAPDLLATNVNRWFAQNPEKRMIRTLDGHARAFLSNRYQRVDNNAVAEVVLPVLAATPGVEVVSCEITDARLYIKAVTHSVRATLKSHRVGDVIEAGISIRNSEVGLGAINVDPWVNFLACLNGMMRTKEGLRSTHIGTRLDGDENLAEMLADDTRRAVDRAVLLKVRDVVSNAMNQAALDKFAADLQRTTGQMIEGDPAAAIETLADDFALAETEKSSVLRHLIEGGNLSRFALIQAVTRTAEDVESYDRATELETMGGRLLDLSADNWSRIAKAA